MIHSRRVSEEIDDVAERGAAGINDPIEVIDEFLATALLIQFAMTPAPLTADLLPSSFTAGPATSDYSYVKDAAAADNPAQADLGGLAPNTYALKVKVAEQFQIKVGSIGGRAYRPYRSDHTTGHAIDIPGSGARGQAIADWVTTVAAAYKVKYIIFNYRIWYPGKGWQSYNPSSGVRGFSSDAGHVRHVHVSTY